METTILKTKYSKILIKSEIEGITEKIQPYLYGYATLSTEDSKDNIDATVYIFQTIKNNRSMKINAQKQEIGILLEDMNRDNQLYLKRALINLNNRILESKGVIFIHASSISYNGNGIMFIGERGNGKTTNMLYMLNQKGIEYVANDRTGIKLNKETGKVEMLGIPSSINVRPGSIEKNSTLKTKLMPVLSKKGYYELIKDTDNKSMKSRMCLTIQEIKDNLGITERPISILQGIVFLNYDQNIEYNVANISLEEMTKKLEEQRISGVFSGTKEIENVIEVQQLEIKDILKQQKIKTMEITQNSDNSKKILENFIISKGEKDNVR